MGGERSDRGNGGEAAGSRRAAAAARELEQAVPPLADWMHAGRLVNLTA